MPNLYNCLECGEPISEEIYMRYKLCPFCWEMLQEQEDLESEANNEEDND